MLKIEFTRREALAGLAAGTALPLLARAPPAFAEAASEGRAKALLDSFAENLLQLSPESATSLGVDTGARAKLRYQLGDRSAAGQRRVAATLKSDLGRAEALDTSGLSITTRTSIEVVKSAYTTALEGFALPYGDVAVGRLAQYALRRDPERRRLSRHAKVPRHRSPDRKCLGRRGVSQPPLPISGPARRRGRAHARGPVAAPRSAQLPDRQGDRPADAFRQECA